MTKTNISINTSFAALIVLSKFENEIKLLLLKRTKENYWCHVGGKIENSETAWQTTIRELKEETSLDVEVLYVASYIDQFYEPQENRINIVPVFVTFVLPQSIIELDCEHTEYRWCSLEEAKALVPYPNMKELYDHVWKYFVNQQPSDRLLIYP